MNLKRIIKLWPFHKMDIGRVDKDILFTLFSSGQIPVWRLRHDKQGIIDEVTGSLSREIDRVVASFRQD